MIVTNLSVEIQAWMIYGYITNSHTDQLPDSLIAQLVEHSTGIAEVQILLRPELFFQDLISKNCDDRSYFHKHNNLLV